MMNLAIGFGIRLVIKLLEVEILCSLKIDGLMMLILQEHQSIIIDLLDFNDSKMLSELILFLIVCLKYFRYAHLLKICSKSIRIQKSEKYIFTSLHVDQHITHVDWYSEKKKTEYFMSNDWLYPSPTLGYDGCYFIALQVPYIHS